MALERTGGKDQEGGDGVRSVFSLPLSLRVYVAVADAWYVSSCTLRRLFVFRGLPGCQGRCQRWTRSDEEKVTSSAEGSLPIPLQAYVLPVHSFRRSIFSIRFFSDRHHYHY
jgi:hypothetical protein